MNKRGRFLTSLVVGSVLAISSFPVMASAEAPDDSGIVIRIDDWLALGYRDAADDLVALGGPPAEQWCIDVGWEDYVTQYQFAHTPPGATVMTVHGSDLPVWVYRASLFAEVCDVVLGGGSPELIASGTVRLVVSDNDLFASETRTNSFGHSAIGTVVDAHGDLWSFSAEFRGQIAPSQGDECFCRIVRENITLSRRGT